MNNIILVREQLKNFQRISNSQAFLRKHASLLPPLEKYANSTDDVTETKTVIGFQETCKKSIDAMYLSSVVAHNQIKELQVFISSLNFLSSLLVLICMLLAGILCACLLFFLHFIV